MEKDEAANLAPGRYVMVDIGGISRDAYVVFSFRDGERVMVELIGEGAIDVACDLVRLPSRGNIGAAKAA